MINPHQWVWVSLLRLTLLLTLSSTRLPAVTLCLLLCRMPSRLPLRRLLERQTTLSWQLGVTGSAWLELPCQITRLTHESVPVLEEWRWSVML